MHLGTLNTQIYGYCTKFNLFFTDCFNGSSTQHKQCTLFFLTSNGGTTGYSGTNYVGVGGKV